LRALEFLTAVVIGRTPRYSMWGILAVLYGNSVKLYMQQNLNFIGMVLFGGFVVFAAIRYHPHSGWYDEGPPEGPLC
jgi:hypothetical protein